MFLFDNLTSRRGIHEQPQQCHFLIVSLIPVDDDSWNPWGEEFERKGWHKPHPLPLEPFNRREDELDKPAGAP